MTDLIAVAYTDFWFDSLEPERTPAQRLWLAVIMRTLQDALGLTNLGATAAHHHMVKIAQNFFLEPSPSFMRTCAFADVDARGLRERVLPMVRRYQQTGEQPKFITDKQLKPRAAA